MFTCNISFICFPLSHSRLIIHVSSVSVSGVLRNDVLKHFSPEARERREIIRVGMGFTAQCESHAGFHSQQGKVNKRRGTEAREDN